MVLPPWLVNRSLDSEHDCMPRFVISVELDFIIVSEVDASLPGTLVSSRFNLPMFSLPDPQNITAWHHFALCSSISQTLFNHHSILLVLASVSLLSSADTSLRPELSLSRTPAPACLPAPQPSGTGASAPPGCSSWWETYTIQLRC